MNLPLNRKFLSLVALVLVTMLLGACSSTRGCVANLCVYPPPEGWRLAYTEFDDDNNGIINSITRYVYSPEGEVITMLIEDLDSSSEKRHEYRHDFDGQGRILRLNADFEFGEDFKLDGEFETTMLYHYDRHGNLYKVEDLLSTIIISYDDSCSVKKLIGKTGEYRSLISYDEYGKRAGEQTSVLKETRGKDNTGFADSKLSRKILNDFLYKYDESGLLTRIEGPLLNTFFSTQFGYDNMGRLSEKRFIVTRGREPGGEYFFGDTTFYYWEEIRDTSAQMRYTHPCP